MRLSIASAAASRGFVSPLAQVGRELRVMVDSMDGFDAIARSEFDAPEIDNLVRIPGLPAIPGMVLRVRVVAVDDMDLIAEPVIE